MLDLSFLEYIQLVVFSQWGYWPLPSAYTDAFQCAVNTLYELISVLGWAFKQVCAVISYVSSMQLYLALTCVCIRDHTMVELIKSLDLLINII